MANGATLKVKYLSSGRPISAREFNAQVKNFNLRVNDVPSRAAKKVPPNFESIVSNRVRKYWRDNFRNQYLWKQPSLTAAYRDKKNKMLQRGDSFKIGSYPAAKITAGGNIFGTRTGTTMKFFSRADNAEVKSFGRKVTRGQGRGIDVLLAVRLNADKFENRGDYQKNGVTGRKYRQKRSWKNNQLLLLSSRVTKGRTHGGTPENSVLIRLAPSQLNDVSRYILRTYGVLIRNTVQGVIRGKK